jgi:hypothetical protein
VLGALVLGLTLAGCSQVESQPEPASELRTGGISFEEFAANVPREPETGFYIVDGDTVLHSVEELRAFYEQHVREGALTAYTTGADHVLWPESQRQDLSYCVSTAFGGQHSTVVQAMANAAAAWQGPTGVRFVYRGDQDGNCTASNTNVLFDVRPVSGGAYLARAFFPNDGRSTRNVLIDWSAFTASWSLTGILRHELGHVLGFRHEHIRVGSGCSEDSSWTGVTTYDSASVMHYPQCNGTNTGDLVLTQRDIEGAAIAYGQTNFVGVIPAANGCPTSAPEVRINMDNEDRNEASYVSGWVGGTQRDGNGNLRFVFCRVGADQFRALNSVSSSRSNYAVLRLSGRCPADSVEFERQFDNEDNNNANNSSGVLWPSVMNNNTRMRFCLFRGGSSYGTGLPDLGFDYGVFAESNFGFTTTSGGTGVIYSDDEDNNNANAYYADATWKADATRIVTEGTNTSLRTARRGSPYCGDYRCNALETTSSCPGDCEVCGNGYCGGSESVYSCPSDCAVCGDGICSSGEYCTMDCGSTCSTTMLSDGNIKICPIEEQPL